ncbi:hypothetical protein BRC82_02625 [Halobacteriales archaeon QS_1_67_19]|nr:MAG: hypothetical protein BRC82_02625 [Halobacteriales archaeon QS_1_67_19]
MSLVGGTLGKVAAVLVAGAVVSAAGLGAALSTGVLNPEAPTVESIDNQWGEVTDERTAIETTAVVHNPNDVGLPGVAGVAYDVQMNDVTVAEGSSGKLSLSPGRNEVTLRTHVDNEKIPAWWASHINNGETTTVAIEPEVTAPIGGKSLPARERTFETDLLAAFDRDGGPAVTMGDRTLLTVEGTSASWGEATENETPLHFAGTVRNPNEQAIEFAEVGYVVSMNGVTVAEGTTGEPVAIGAESTATIEIDSTLDNAKLDEWWVSHLRNDERTVLEVQAFAVVETDDGTQRVPLSFLSKRVAFETDILGGGEATTETLSADPDFEPPTVERIDPDWQPTDDGTRFASRVVVDNPNPPESTLGNVSVDASYRVDLNDVTLLDDEHSARLESGRNEYTFAAEVRDETIREWWTSHVENGERTTLTTEATVVADLGFAAVPVELPARERTFETDLLAGFSGTEQQIEVNGVTVGTIEDMDASWGEPTAERTPMIVAGEVTNERARSLTIVKFGYEVRMNDVVLADDESRVDTTIPGKTTRRVESTGHLNNGKIDDWWASHLENGERSELSVSYYAVVEYNGERYTVELDAVSYNDTIETDAFGTA